MIVEFRAKETEFNMKNTKDIFNPIKYCNNVDGEAERFLKKCKYNLHTLLAEARRLGIRYGAGGEDYDRNETLKRFVDII